jgi:hypothetical protein
VAEWTLKVGELARLKVCLHRPWKDFLFAPIVHAFLREQRNFFFETRIWNKAAGRAVDGASVFARLENLVSARLANIVTAE